MTAHKLVANQNQCV